MKSFFRKPSRKDELAVEEGYGNGRTHVTFLQRIDHVTWAWFTFPLSTGGISLLLAATPHRFDGLNTCGKVFLIIDLAVTLALLASITMRFIRTPPALIGSITHPSEALFFAAVIINFAMIFACSQIYGGAHVGHWFVVAMQVCYWVYVGVAFSLSVLQYLYLFTAPPTRLTIQGMTPAWILPVFPATLCGTLASILAPAQSADNGFTMIIAGISFQGLGWMVAFLMYAAYIHRLMGYGLPVGDLRPGMFISVGPPSFTSLALIDLSLAIPERYGYFNHHPASVEILQTMATFIAIFLWMLAFWFFCVTTTSILMSARWTSFRMIWWALIFPNCGFAIATTRIGQRLQSSAILWVASVQTVILVALWVCVLVAMIWAVFRKKILWPGKDEDKDFLQEYQRRKSSPSPV